MANVTFYHQSIDNATLSINTLTSDASYPLTNLQDRSKNVYWKAGNANTSGYIQIDLGSARACDYLILGSHNYTNTGVGIALSSCTDGDGLFTPEAWAIGSAGPTYHNYVSGNVTNWIETFSSVTKRYWRLYPEAMGAATYQQIATIFLGTKFEHSVNWSYGSGRLEYQWGVQVGETTGGIRRRQKNHDERKIWQYTFEWIDETHHDNILSWAQSVYGNWYPFFMGDEYFASGTDLCYVALANSAINFSHIKYQLYHNPIRLEEEL